MIEELWKNSAIIAKRNVDSNQTPISVKLIELKQIIDAHSCVVLNQLPDESYGINIEGFTEVYDIEDITTKSFKVDYANGVIYFHPYNVGKNIVVDYSGIGCCLLSASRVYTKYDKHNNVIETLEELIDNAKLQLKAIETLGGAVEVINRVENANEIGTVLHENLTNDIEVATPLQKDLNDNIKEANTFRVELNKDVADGKVLNTDLRQNIIGGKNTNADLIHSTELAQGSIDLIRGSGNEVKLISKTDWSGTAPDLTYTWNHGLKTKNITVTISDEDSGEFFSENGRIVDENNVLIRSDVARNLRIVASARFYSGGLDTKEEIISARKGLPSLTDKITSIDTKVAEEQMKSNYLLNGSIIIENDVQKLNSLLRTGKGVRYGVLGDSLEAGIGNVGQNSYGEGEYMWYYSANDLFALSLMESDVNFIRCSNEVYTTYNAGMGSLYFPLPTHQIKKSDNATISYILKQNQLYKQDKLTIYFLERTHDESARFDVVVNGTSTAYVETYVPPITLNNGNSINVSARLGKFTINIPAENQVEITIKNVRAIDRGNGVANEALAVICGFAFGYGITYRNFAVASMTAKDESDLNISKGVTTTGQLTKLQVINPNIVGIGFGTNDSRAGTSTSLIEAYKTNMRNIIDNIKTKNPNTIIILFSAPVGETGSGYEFNQPYFKAMKEVAIEKVVNFIDVYEICKLSSRTDIMADHIHLNPIGYQLKGEAIRKAFKLNPFSIGGATITNPIPTAGSVDVNGVSFTTANTWETFMTLTLAKPNDKNQLVMMAKIPMESATDINSHLKLFLNGVEMDYTLAKATATSGNRLVYATLMRHYTVGNSSSYTIEVRGKDYTVATYSTTSPNRARLVAYWV